MPTSSCLRRHVLALPLAAALSSARGAGSSLTLRLPDPNAYSAHGQFFIEVLKLALSKTSDGEHPPTLIHSAVDLPRERLRQMLADGQLDLLWSTTTPDREAQALPVRFNLLKGTNELRFLLVRSADLPALRELRTLDALRRLRAGAGTYWSDAQILRTNGFTVETTPKFDALFRMLKAGRFDFIPRTREEIDIEVVKHPELGLVELPGLALQYRQPLYFFVARNRPQLAERLQRGLALAVADGSFDALFMAEPGLKTALAQLRGYTGLRLQLRAL
ncbi:transporter substrate-binding domain-containing protein [Roseateles sp.]|uniref:substrate-binding periplasmic protein n=1 Tax=Roseateles sp. TaxID=1971397 RepID=UPI003267EBD2